MFSEYLTIALIAGIWLVTVFCIASWIVLLAVWLQLRWLKYFGVSLVPVCLCAIIVIALLQAPYHLFTAVFLTVILGLPFLLVVSVTALIWRFGEKRQLRWLQYSGLTLCPLFLIVSISHTTKLAQEVRHPVEIPGYRVEFFEAGGIGIEYFRYFYVYRPDGQRAEFVLDNDSSRCLDLKVQTQGDRIYFQCSGEPLSEASFVDKAKQTVYSGWFKQEQSISELKFQSPENLN